MKQAADAETNISVENLDEDWLFHDKILPVDGLVKPTEIRNKVVFPQPLE